VVGNPLNDCDGAAIAMRAQLLTFLILFRNRMPFGVHCLELLLRQAGGARPRTRARAAGLAVREVGNTVQRVRGLIFRNAERHQFRNDLMQFLVGYVVQIRFVAIRFDSP
jgi:hypothetical protein